MKLRLPGPARPTPGGAHLTLICLAICAAVPAVSMTQTSEARARVEHLQKSLLAPCCYAEPVAHHQSEASIKMRLEIQKSVDEGRSDREILDAYVATYGAKILVDPRTEPKEWTVAVPWVLTAVAAAGLAAMLRRWRRTRVAAAPAGSGAAPLPDLPDLDDE